MTSFLDCMIGAAGWPVLASVAQVAALIGRPYEARHKRASIDEQLQHFVRYVGRELPQLREVLSSDVRPRFGWRPT